MDCIQTICVTRKEAKNLDSWKRFLANIFLRRWGKARAALLETGM